jgi:hypothetical protein
VNRDRKKLIVLLRRLGIPLDLRRGKMWFDGRAVAAGPSIPIDDIAHEAAHWLTATPGRRLLINYGLGTDPDGNKDSAAVLSGQRLREEEMLASGAGALLLALAGLPFGQVFSAHDWQSGDGKAQRDLRRCAARLKRRGVDVSLVLEKVDLFLRGFLTAWDQRISDPLAFAAFFEESADEPLGERGEGSEAPPASRAAGR